MTPDELLSRFMLALCVYREASGESDLGKLLVAQVIENRVNDPRWPNTYVGVITQKKQFSSFNANDPNNSRWPKDGEPSWQACVKAADEVMGSSVLKYTNANHYHTTAVNPPWADVSKITETEGNHVFYCL